MAGRPEAGSTGRTAEGGTGVGRPMQISVPDSNGMGQEFGIAGSEERGIRMKVMLSNLN